MWDRPPSSVIEWGRFRCPLPLRRPTVRRDSRRIDDSKGDEAMTFRWYAEATHDRPAASVARRTEYAAIRGVDDTTALRQVSAHQERAEARRRSGAR